MKLFNLHTHTLYSDGHAQPEAFIREAIRQGFDVLGFSEHAPVPMENDFAIEESQLDDYAGEIAMLKNKYQDEINIYTAFEFDYIPGITRDFEVYAKQCKIDYAIGSVHLVKNGSGDHLWFIDGPRIKTYDDGLRNTFGGDIRKAVKAYYYQINEMISTQDFEIIGHLDKIKMHNKNRFFMTDEKWYMDLVMESLDLIRQKDIIVEVNTRGIYKKRCETLFPETNILRKIKEMNIRLTVSSDAHQPADLSKYFPETIRILQDIGFRELVCLSEKGWRPRLISNH
ncbi:MAG: histidinol-phosphatase [Bacteroidota bacterium]|nr:histidinol-phosphatase [Bacteroidota bacterium]